MLKIYQKLSRFATGKALIFLAAAFLVAAVLNVGPPFGIAQLNEITDDAGVLDEMSYSADKAYAVLKAQGEHGRAFYKRLLLTTELVFPLVYRGFSAVLITYLFGRWLAPTSPWRFLSLLPFVGMLADYGENTLVLMMLFAYPQRLDAVATIASAFTRVKWASNYVDWALIVVSLIGLVVYAVTKRRSSAPA
jgi:hypothetical protein